MNILRHRKSYQSLILITSLAFILSGCGSVDTIKQSFIDTWKEYSPQFLGAGSGFVAGLIAAQQCKRQFRDKQSVDRCVGLVITSATIAGYYWAKKLSEENQKKMITTTDKVANYGGDQTWVDKENNISGSAKVVSTEVKPVEKPKPVKVLKDAVEELPPFEIISEPYTVSKSVNLRGGPSTDYKIVGQMKPDEIFTVLGRVEGKNWFVVSQNGIASGFIYEKLTVAAPDATPTWQIASTSSSDITSKSPKISQKCRKIEQSVVNTDGVEDSRFVQACKGENGWEMSEA